MTVSGVQVIIIAKDATVAKDGRAGFMIEQFSSLKTEMKKDSQTD